jgi:hypothetical protein
VWFRWFYHHKVILHQPFSQSFSSPFVRLTVKNVLVSSFLYCGDETNSAKIVPILISLPYLVLKAIGSAILIKMQHCCLYALSLILCPKEKTVPYMASFIILYLLCASLKLISYNLLIIKY